MDQTTRTLVEYATTFGEGSYTPAAREAAVNHLVDSIACAIAGHRTESAQVAIDVARRFQADRDATVWGGGFGAAPPYAVFANTIMVRSLDWNDGMLAPGGGHPSDMIPSILAAGEVTSASGADVVRAIILAYELLGGLGRVAHTNARGFDQGLFMGVAVALATGMLHGLDEEQLANAVSLSIVPAAPLLVTRRGSLSMWKGAATASAVLHATNAVAFARAGMTGPAEPFDGTAGVKEVVSGPFDLALPAHDDGRFVVEVSHQKRFPAESHSQSLLGLAPEIRAWAPLDEIESIDIEAYAVLVRAIGSDPSVWDPQTRETADHSLPYLLSVALVDGAVTPASFAPTRIADPSLRPIMAKVRVRENPEFTAAYRPAGMELTGSPRVRVVVTRTSGERLERVLTYPLGHSRNPMKREDVDRKFDEATAGILEGSQREELRDAWWGIGEVTDVGQLTRLLADLGAGAAVGSH